MSSRDTGDLIETLFINLSQKVDTHHHEISQEISDLKDCINTKFQVFDSKLEDHDRHFKLMGTVFNWCIASVGLGGIGTIISQFFNKPPN